MCDNFLQRDFLAIFWGQKFFLDSSKVRLILNEFEPILSLKEFSDCGLSTALRSINKPVVDSCI
jgi:hypothetical protein